MIFENTHQFAHAQNNACRPDETSEQRHKPPLSLLTRAFCCCKGPAAMLLFAARTAVVSSAAIPDLL
jgi:hypothetical protein